VDIECLVLSMLKRPTYMQKPPEMYIYIDLPPGDEEPGMCGKLNYTLYGTRDAAQSWELEYSGTLQKWGFIKGFSTGCVFRNPQRNIDAWYRAFGVTKDDAMYLPTESRVRIW